MNFPLGITSEKFMREDNSRPADIKTYPGDEQFSNVVILREKVGFDLIKSCLSDMILLLSYPSEMFHTIHASEKHPSGKVLREWLEPNRY